MKGGARVKSWAIVALVVAVIALGIAGYTWKITRPAPAPPAQAPAAPRVGCTACHAKRSPAKDYSLGGEALKVANHPTKAPDNTPIDSNTKFSTCMECHATASTGKAKAASVAMAHIAHPVHLFSKTFGPELGGTCWSCHTLDAQGRFLVITEKVDVTDKGIPKQLPIPSLWVPRQGMVTATGG